MENLFGFDLYFDSDSECCYCRSLAVRFHFLLLVIAVVEAAIDFVVVAVVAFAIDSVLELELDSGRLDRDDHAVALDVVLVLAWKWRRAVIACLCIFPSFLSTFQKSLRKLEREKT